MKLLLKNFTNNYRNNLLSRVKFVSWYSDSLTLKLLVLIPTRISCTSEHPA